MPLKSLDILEDVYLFLITAHSSHCDLWMLKNILACYYCFRLIRLYFCLSPEEICSCFSRTVGSTLQFYFIGKKCAIMQDMNRHLEAILKEERALRKRLLKPRCQESLPIEATFHKDIVELLTEAVTFIEKLESHLQTIRSIPQIPDMVNNMETALTKTELLVIELEELTEHILKWRELQRTSVICSTAELDFGLSVT
uniref:HAUS augmin like complex subunit 2 n=1 Tax=Amazona collaria TaxID=241587 RepID=A0A8B9FFR9_9PSIT